MTKILRNARTIRKRKNIMGDKQFSLFVGGMIGGAAAGLTVFILYEIDWRLIAPTIIGITTIYLNVLYARGTI